MDRGPAGHQWREIAELLEGMRERVEETCLDPLAEDPRALLRHYRRLLALESREAETVSNAMLQYASLGSLPSLSVDTAWLVHLRIDNACEFLGVCFDSADTIAGLDPLGPVLPGSPERVFQFLLVDLWESLGRRNFRRWVAARCRE